MRKTTVTTIFSKPMKLVSILVFGVLILSACTSSAATPAVPTNAPQATTAPIATSAPAVTQPPSGAPKPATPPEAVVNISTDSKLGTILVGENGMTLYIFTKDTADTSNCNAECLKKWPALITQGKPVLGDGVDASMVGIATLADGSKVVTYNHMPLYYWYKDTKSGDTNGQAVGDVWFVISPDGKPVGLSDANTNANTNVNTNSNTNTNANTNTNDNANANSNQNSNDNSGNSNGGGGNDNGGGGNDNGGGGGGNGNGGG
jgi:predicted lipoprotein with Yx(FWY)xxD motif